MTLLIKNVRILGSAEKYSEPRDVFISGGKIAAIGDFPNKAADEVFDGQGAYLAPGFIDVNTDSDHYLSLFDDPGQEDFLGQGVTTIVGGMCGSSLAPLIYGGLESVQKWGDISRVNVGWSSMKEFLEAINRRGLGVNFTTLAGHSTIRRAIVGEDLRNLSKNELAVFAGTLRRALKDGALGLSTGLGYVHGYKTPYSEIKFLANIVKESGGVYATHLRDANARLLHSLEETIKLAEETGVKTLVSHFMPVKGSEKEYKKSLEEIDALPKELDFHFDVYPFDASVLPLYTFLPRWAQTGGREEMLKRLKDDWFRKKIEGDLSEIDPKDFMVAQAYGNGTLAGRSLEELIDLYEAPDFRGALSKFMLATDLRAVVFYKNINKNLIKDALRHPRSFVASNAASISEPEKGKILKPERALSTFTKFLAAAVRDKLMTLEEAVKKITSQPAKKFGLKGRGEIKEGNAADLAVFRLDEKRGVAGAGDHAQTARIKFVAVGGAPAFTEERGFSGKPHGRALKHDST